MATGDGICELYFLDLMEMRNYIKAEMRAEKDERIKGCLNTISLDRLGRMFSIRKYHCHEPPIPRFYIRLYAKLQAPRWKAPINYLPTRYS